MIPVLYNNAEKAFVTNGIGRLSDCISCTVTEERNGIYECEFEYPITGVRYKDIQEGCIITVTHDDTGDIQPFDIYSRSAPISGIVTFYAHHVSYRLSDIVVTPFNAGSCAAALDAIPQNSVNTNPFTFWTDKTTTGNFSVDVPDYARAILGGQEGSILDTFGKGDYEWDKWTVKLHLNRGVDSGVEIRYGKNMSDLTHEIDLSSTYNAIVPYWSDTEGSLVMLPEKILIYSGATSRVTDLNDENLQIIREENNEPIEITYKIVDAVPLDLSSEFEEAPTADQLREVARARLESSEAWIPNENIKVDFVQLWQTEEYKDYAPLQRVRLCDTVSVYYPELGVEAVKQKVIKTVYNVLLDRYDSIELGELQTTLAGTITSGIDEKLEDYPDIGYMDKAINQATQLITGGLGGYVVMKLNANNKPEELLIMDNEDINQAVNVWRWNKNGIGYSSTGYNGTYKTAWTIDGSFVADFITSGSMSANLIKGGTLKLGGSNNTNGLLQILDGSGNVITTGNNAGINTKSLTATDYVYVNGGTGSYLKIPSNSTYFTDAYSEISSNGIIVKNGTGSSLSSLTKIGSGSSGIKVTPVTSSEYPNVWIRNDEVRLAHSSSSSVDFSASTSYGAEIYLRTSYGTFQAGPSSVTSNKLGLTVTNSNFICTGTKSRSVSTKDYAKRLLYCYETPSPLFGDVGEGTIGEDGKCFIWLDPVFAETISTDQYQVFLQKYGDGDCYVAERHADYFVVSGTASLSFGWELKAKQSDYDQLRMEPDRENILLPNTAEYGDEAIDHIKALKEGRISA